MSSNGLAGKILTGIAGSALAFLTACDTPTEQKRGLGYGLMAIGATDLGREVVRSANAEEYRNEVNVNVGSGGNSYTPAPQKAPYPNTLTSIVGTAWIDRNGNNIVDDGEVWMDHNDNGLVDGDDEFRGEKVNYPVDKQMTLFLGLPTPIDRGYHDGFIITEIKRQSNSEILYRLESEKVWAGTMIHRIFFQPAHLKRMGPGMYVWNSKLSKPGYRVDGVRLGGGMFIIH